MFTHILNCMTVKSNQIEIIQKMLNQFVWHGRNKICSAVALSPVDHSGLNMLNVKNVVYVLQVKWMNCLSLDCGLSWSRHIWKKIDE